MDSFLSSFITDCKISLGVLNIIKDIIIFVFSIRLNFIFIFDLAYENLSMVANFGLWIFFFFLISLNFRILNIILNPVAMFLIWKQTSNGTFFFVPLIAAILLLKLATKYLVAFLEC